MTIRVRRWCWLASIGLGILALALLWAPLTSTEMSFSGPARACTSYGILTWMEERVDYNPRRHTTSLGTGSKVIQSEPPPLQPGEELWDHHGLFGNDIVILSVQARTATVNYITLVVTVVLTLGVLWFTLLRPMRNLVRSVRSCPGAASSGLPN